MTTVSGNGNGAARAALIEGLIPLAGDLARLEYRCLPAWIGLDEARSVAYLALVQAVDRWDETRGVPLEAWVRLPIRGAVRDLGRRKSKRLAWVPQGDDGRRTMESESSGDAFLHLRSEIREWARTDQVLSREPSPESVVAYHQFQDAIWRAVDRLPPRLQVVVRLRYCTGLRLGEIGRILRSQTRATGGLQACGVKRLHAEAMRMLREGAA